MTAIALKLTNTAARAVKPTARRGRVFNWELAGILTLMGSSAAYAVFTLAHLA